MLNVLVKPGTSDVLFKRADCRRAFEIIQDCPVHIFTHLKDNMKRALESTGIAYRPDIVTNNHTAGHQANIAANAHQPAHAAAPPALFNVAPAITADQLLQRPGVGNALRHVHAGPGAAPATTVPAWSADIPEQIASTVAQLAESGDAEAQYKLGCIKQPATPEATAEAQTWLEKAAAQNHGNAAYKLGVMYLKGKGVPANKEKAFEWLEKSARHGNAMAQATSGKAYFDGDGVEKDMAKAYEWFAKAAAQNEYSSQTFLAHMHCKGIGVEQDFEKAMHFICATNHDDEQSITIDWKNGLEYLQEWLPDDVNMLLPHLFDKARLNEKVKRVVVDGPTVNDQGAIAIAATLDRNTSVETLFLSNCEIGEAGAEAIMEAAYSTVTPLEKIYAKGETGFKPGQKAAMNQRLAQNPQIIALEKKYIQPEIRFESRIGLPAEVTQLIVQELILNDQTTCIAPADGARYATREETAVRVEELLYIIGNGDTVMPPQV